MEAQGDGLGLGQRHAGGRTKAVVFPGPQDGGQASVLEGHKGTPSQGCGSQGARSLRRRVLMLLQPP